MSFVRVSVALCLLASLAGSACRRGEEATSRAAGGAKGTSSASMASNVDQGAERAVERSREDVVGGARLDEPSALVVVLADEGSDEPLRELARALRAPARIVSLPPAAGTDADLPRDAATLVGVAARLREKRPTRGKPILLGAGRGGTVALVAAAREPGAWGAVVVAGAALPKSALPDGPLPDVGAPPLRVYIHHGSRDAVTPVERGGAASDDLALRGLAAVLHLDPHAGHELSPHLVAEMRARLTEEIRDLP